MLRHFQKKYGIQLVTCTKIGGGELIFPHYGTIVINGNAKIGDNAIIFQSVTIGSVAGKGIPKIGNNVTIYPNSIIIGNVTIGDNVIIGAESVIYRDIPDNVTVARNPAKNNKIRNVKMLLINRNYIFLFSNEV